MHMLSRLESRADRRESHCHRFAEGLPDCERTNDMLPLPDARNLRNAIHYSINVCVLEQAVSWVIPIYKSGGQIICN